MEGYHVITEKCPPKNNEAKGHIYTHFQYSIHKSQDDEINVDLRTFLMTRLSVLNVMRYASLSRSHTHVHMALAGYFIVFSFVTKPGQTLEFLLWGTIVPLNFLAGYYCSIVASTPQPTVYAFKLVNTGKRGPPIVPLLFRNTSHMFCTRLANGGLFPTGDHIVPFVISPQFECLNKRTHTANNSELSCPV